MTFRAFVLLVGLALSAAIAPRAEAQTSDADQQLLINRTLQDALIWAGHYDGLSDGSLGKKSIEAITAFQRQQGGPATGELLPDQKLRLLHVAQQQRAAVGFKIFEEPRTTSQVGVPLGLVQDRGATTHGTRYASADGSIEIVVTRFRPTETTMKGLLERVTSGGEIQKQTLRVVRRDVFFVAGEGGQRDYYFTARDEGGFIRGLRIVTPSARQGELGKIIVASANAFHNTLATYADVAKAIAPAPPPPSANRSPEVASYSARVFVARETLIPIVNALMADVSVTAYKILPPQTEDDRHNVTWLTEDGTAGELMAVHAGSKFTVQDVSNHSIQRSAKTCKGELATVRPAPRFSRGSEVQRVETRCATGSTVTTESYSIIELPSGPILRFTHWAKSSAAGQPSAGISGVGQGERVEDAAIVRAQMFGR